MPDTDGFFTHPFGGGAGHRQIRNTFTKSAGLYHLGSRNQDAAVIGTGSDAEYRRHANGLTHLLESAAGQVRGLRRTQASLGQRNLRTAGLQHQERRVFARTTAGQEGLYVIWKQEPEANNYNVGLGLDAEEREEKLT